MKKISIILISIVLLLLASSCDGQVFSELMDTESQTIDYTTVPLTLEFTANGELSFVIPENIQRNLQYSKNGGEKKAYSEPIPVVKGDIVRLYAEAADQDYNHFLKIICTSDCYVYGNVMSLLYPDNFATNTTITNSYALYGLFKDNAKITNHETKKLVLPATTLAGNCYEMMFYRCTALTKAPELPAETLSSSCYNGMFFGCTGLTEAPKLPATTLATSCYEGMFYGCTKLTTAPELPATTLANCCYEFMFQNCTGLTQAPELPATTLESMCYQSMFFGCTSLTTAPELPATTLAYHCYYCMFYGCTKLESITCLASTISADDCTTDWLKDVSPTGTFTKASAMNNWERSSSGIPSGWTIEEDVDPLTLEFISDGTLLFTNPRSSLQYSKNGGDKTEYSAPIPVEAGDRVRLYAEGADQDYFNYFTINCTSECYVYGNVMSLLDPVYYATNKTITKSYALNGLFKGNTYIKNHATKKLILPAITLANYCYFMMFYGCTGLTEAPELPATTLANNCYQRMFHGCTGLTKAPELLPATTLAGACYSGMFSGCTSLTKAPELPATALAESCYSEMFSNCANLSSITCLATDISASNCTTYWLNGVSSEGTFTKASDMVDWESGPSGIPSGWTVVDKQ